jgi:hypothetical protein
MRTRNTRLQQKESNNGRFAVVSNLFVIVGVCIMLAALIYMIVNLDKADTIIKIWIPFIVAGLSLTFWGLIFRLWHKRNIYSKKHYTFVK